MRANVSCLSIVLSLLIPATSAVGAEVQIPQQSEWADGGIVLEPGPQGSWDVRFSGSISPCTVVKKNDTYFLYYIGADGDRSTDGGPRHRALGVATSCDGIHFTKYPKNPILTFLPHEGTRWDEEEGIFAAGATLDNNGQVVLYYGAMTATSRTLVKDDARLAISNDGLNFIDVGIVIDHSDPTVWGYGDELDPLGVFHSGGLWYVYYVSANGVGTRWDLGMAWGPARHHLPNTGPVLTEGSYIIGGCDPMWVRPDKIALFIVRDFDTREIEVRTASVSAPDVLSDPVHTYLFGNMRHATVFLDNCPADLDGDGNVNGPDLLALLEAWGSNPGHPADLNGDGTVAVPDLLNLLANWGDCQVRTWFLYYRNADGSAIRVMTAPVVVF